VRSFALQRERAVRTHQSRFEGFHSRRTIGCYRQYLHTKDQRNQIIQDTVLSYSELAKWEQRLSRLHEAETAAQQMETAVAQRVKEGVTAKWTAPGLACRWRVCVCAWPKLAAQPTFSVNTFSGSPDCRLPPSKSILSRALSARGKARR